MNGFLCEAEKRDALPNERRAPPAREPFAAGRRRDDHLVAYFNNCAHFWIAAVLLGSAFWRHFEYFSNWAGDGFEPDEPEPEEPEPDDPEPPEPDAPPEPPRPPSPPPRPPSCCWSSEIGFAFAGAVIVFCSPTFAKSIEKVRLPPSAPWNCERADDGISKSTETDRRRIFESSLPTQ